MSREDPPEALFIVDEHSLHRNVGSPRVMAGQLRHLADVAARPSITLQVLPAVAHPATQSGFLIADGAAYAEHVAGGFVYTDEGTVSWMMRLFDTLRGESYRVSESPADDREARRDIMDWRKSTYSGANGGDCVEAASGSGAVAVRDTANRGGITLSVPVSAWTAFLSTLR